MYAILKFVLHTPIIGAYLIYIVLLNVNNKYLMLLTIFNNYLILLCEKGFKVFSTISERAVHIQLINLSTNRLLDN